MGIDEPVEMTQLHPDASLLSKIVAGVCMYLASKGGIEKVPPNTADGPTPKGREGIEIDDIADVFMVDAGETPEEEAKLEKDIAKILKEKRKSPIPHVRRQHYRTIRYKDGTVALKRIEATTVGEVAEGLLLKGTTTPID